MKYIVRMFFTPHTQLQFIKLNTLMRVIRRQMSMSRFFFFNVYRFIYKYIYIYKYRLLFSLLIIVQSFYITNIFTKCIFMIPGTFKPRQFEQSMLHRCNHRNIHIHHLQSYRYHGLNIQHFLQYQHLIDRVLIQCILLQRIFL